MCTWFTQHECRPTGTGPFQTLIQVGLCATIRILPFHAPAVHNGWCRGQNHVPWHDRTHRLFAATVGEVPSPTCGERLLVLSQKQRSKQRSKEQTTAHTTAPRTGPKPQPCARRSYNRPMPRRHLAQQMLPPDRGKQRRSPVTSVHTFQLEHLHGFTMSHGTYTFSISYDLAMLCFSRLAS